MSRKAIRIPTTSPEGDSGVGARDEALRDLVVATAYGKDLLLDVPVFKNAHRYAIDYADEARPAWTVTGHDLDDQVVWASAAVSRVMARSTRLEPQNGVALHRSYPSPRSLFPVEVTFEFRTGETSARFRYDPDYEAFFDPDGDGPQMRGRATAMSLRLVAVLPRIAPLYGDLAVTLCALEAGHLASELARELSAAGFEVKVSAAAAPLSSAPSTDEIVLAELDLGEVKFVDPCGGVGAAIRRPRPLLSSQDLQVIRTAYDNLRCDPAASEELASILPDRDDLERPPSAARTSGSFPNGVMGRRTPPAETDRMVTRLLKDLGARLDRGPSFKPQVVALLSQRDGSVRVCSPTAADRYVPDGCIPLSEAYGTAFNIDLQTVPIILVFTAQMGHLLATSPAWAYLQMLVFTGALAQNCCLRAATHGYFARPYRGMVEDTLERAVGLSGQAFYTILIGRPAAANPSLTVQAAPPAAPGSTLNVLSGGRS